MVNIVTESLTTGALGASGVTAWRWDIGDQRIDWSSNAEEIIGLPDIVLRSPELLMRAIHPDDFPLVSEAYGKALRAGTALDARFRLTVSDGVRWFDCVGQPVLDANGRTVGATGTLADVTEECEAEEALLATLHDAQSVLGEIGARLWRWDPRSDVITQISLSNEDTALMAGGDGEVSLAILLERLDPQSALRVREEFARGLRDREPFAFEVCMRDDDGRARRVYVRGGVDENSPQVLNGVSILLD